MIAFITYIFNIRYIWLISLFLLCLAMFTMVQYAGDNTYHVCNSDDVRKKVAKWKNKYYEAKTIISSNSYELLDAFCNNIEKGYPVVELGKIVPPSSLLMLELKQVKWKESGDEHFEKILDCVPPLPNIGNVAPEDSVAVIEDISQEEKDKLYDYYEEDPFSTDEDPSYVPISESEEDEETEYEEDEENQDEFTVKRSKIVKRLLFDKDHLSSTSDSENSSLGIIPIASCHMSTSIDPINVIRPIETPVASAASKERTTNSYLCMFCGYLVDDLTNHLRQNHKDQDISIHFIDEEPGISKYGKTYPSKAHYCLYCGSLQKKLARHLERKHKVEECVLNALKVPKGSSERKKLFSDIQKRGDFKYNEQNPNSSIGIRRIANKSPTPDNIIPCPYCKGFYSKINLRNHVRLNCGPHKDDPLDEVQRINLQVASRRILPHIHPKACKVLREEVFPRMRNDKTTRAVVYDESVINYANLMIIKYSMSGHHYKMVRNRIRHISRILLTMRKINSNITNVASMFHPANFDDFVEAIHRTAGLNNGKYDAPSCATHSCTIAMQFVDSIICDCIKNNDVTMKKNVENFKFLLKLNQNALITKVAGENRTQSQRSKIEILPTTQEVNKLFCLLDTEINSCLQKLQHKFDLISWTNLAKLTLVQIMIFNRKRPGDVEKCQIIEYRNVQILDCENMAKLSEANRSYAANFGRFICRGKLNKPAPTLVSKTNMAAINALLKYRTLANVSPKNPYLFGTPQNSTELFFSAAIALKEFCIAMKLPHRKLIATKLRKHLATSTCTLAKGEQLVISDFMGHAFDIHNNIYRQRPVLTDVVQMGKVLTEAIGGIAIPFTPTTTNPEKTISLSLVESIPGPSYQLNDLSCDNLSPSRNFDHSFDDNSLENTEENELMDIANCFQPDLSTIGEEDDIGNNSGKECKTIKKVIKKRTRLFPKSDLQKRRRTWRTPERKLIRQCFNWCLEEKVVPSLNACQDMIHENDCLSARSPQQLRNWIAAEIKRLEQSAAQDKKSGWNTPSRQECRKYFSKYYTTNTYPSTMELQCAIDTIPELANKTTNQLRSHLQHDYKYLAKTN